MLRTEKIMTTLADRKILKNQKNIINAYHNQFLKSSFSFFLFMGKIKFIFSSTQLVKKIFQSVLPCLKQAQI